METFIFMIELVGTIAFAISGAMTGIEKKMDIFGISILGLTTAVGGGIIRDLVIGMTPPQTFRNPIYAATAIVTAVLTFVLAYGRKLNYNTKLFEILVFVMDSLGLGIFTVVGISTTLANMEHTHPYGRFLLIFVGVVTGVGGGVMRDVMAGNMPYIFVKHVYACASIAGAVICVYIEPFVGIQSAMILGMGIVVLIRFLSAYFKWNLPRIK